MPLGELLERLQKTMWLEVVWVSWSILVCFDCKGADREAHPGGRLPPLHQRGPRRCPWRSKVAAVRTSSLRAGARAATVTAQTWRERCT